MDEIKILMKALTKDEACQICRHFSIHAQGFTFNIEKAPEPLILAAIRNELTKAFKKQSRRGKKHISIKEVYDFLTRNGLTNREDNEITSFEDFCTRIEMEPSYYSNATVVSLLKTQFEDVYKEHHEEILENMEQNRFVLQGIIKESSTEEKLNRIKTKIMDEKKYRRILEEVKERIIDKIGKDKFEELTKKVAGDERNLTKQLMEFKSSEQHISMTGFLLTNDQYKKEEYAVFLNHIITTYYEQVREEYEDDIKEMNKTSFELEEEREEYKNLKETYNELNHQYHILSENYKEIERRNKQLSQQLQNEQNEKTMLDDNQHQNEQITFPIKKQIESLNLLIVTNEQIFIEMELFKDRVISVNDFSRRVRLDDKTFFQDHCFGITRISYGSTMKWRTHESSLKQNGVPYVELSGFEMQGYIEQIMEFLYQKERVNTW